MLNRPGKAISSRLASLEEHLRAENPTLLAVVPTYRRMDRVLYRMGLLGRDESLATRIPWWPMVSVLGTFSSGKSTFINHLLGETLQATGNQAVDDKFTVICYGPGDHKRVLPGTALDADPRFPFYRMGEEIDKVAEGEGKRIDSYLQLKTTASPFAKGKIVIDSPGFDADDQRRSTLRLTSHIVDLSDLVLVMFDARHPEPGAMHDTLQHLVAGTVRRPDAGKFLYILNQIDTAAREDNPEAVVAAWQRAIAQAGLTAGRFFTVYNEEAAVHIDDAALRQRFRHKRDKDMAEIMNRLGDVEVERQYRIVGALETVAGELEKEMLPALEKAVARWRGRALVLDGVAAALFIGLMVALEVGTGGGIFAPISAFLASMTTKGLLVAGGLLLALLFGLHFWLRGLAARAVARDLPEKAGSVDLDLRQAFMRNTSVWHSMFRKFPVGWGAGAKRRLQEIRVAAQHHVQRLNDLYTDPSGKRQPAAVPTEAADEKLEEKAGE